MPGPWPHPDSGIWYFRRALPSDLWRQRDRLKELNISVKREVHRSLNTHDRKLAEVRYGEVNSQVTAQWQAWRKLLEGGPVDLDHMDAVALAGEEAKSFIKAHERNPLNAPGPAKLVKAICDNLHAYYSRKSLADGQAVFELGQKIQSVPYFHVQEFIANARQSESAVPKRHLLDTVDASLATYFEVFSEVRTRKVTRDVGLSLTRSGKQTLSRQVSRYWPKVWQKLAEMSDGDYSVPEWATNLPAFDIAEVRPSETQVTFASIMDEEERLSDKRLKGHIKSTATFRKYRTVLKQFAVFRKSEDAASVTQKEAEDWRDFLMAEAAPAKTVCDKVNAVRAVIGWGQFQSGGKLFPNGDPLRFVDLPEPEESDSEHKTYSQEQARKILKASRQETKPHLRWVPWLLAYSGARVGDIARLERKDFSKRGDYWFFHIRPPDGRTTGKQRARYVPVHPAILDEDFLSYLETSKDGPLFQRSTQQRLGEWIKEVALPDDTNRPAPNHAWRHLFEARCRTFLSQGAALYVTGRSSGTTADRYGGGDQMLIDIAKQMENFPRIL